MRPTIPAPSNLVPIAGRHAPGLLGGGCRGQYVQLDDVVVVETPLPDGRLIRLFGVVDVVRARHEGARFDSDVFLIEEGVRFNVR